MLNYPADDNVDLSEYARGLQGQIDRFDSLAASSVPVQVLAERFGIRTACYQDPIAKINTVLSPPEPLTQIEKSIFEELSQNLAGSSRLEFSQADANFNSRMSEEPLSRFEYELAAPNESVLRLQPSEMSFERPMRKQSDLATRPLARQSIDIDIQLFRQQSSQNTADIL
jgi:hypothetical protein